MDDALLPDDDLDLALAQTVERGGASSDPLFAHLTPLRAEAPPVLAARSAALWARIEAETLPAPRRTDRPAVAPPRTRGRIRWGTVAAFASLTLLAAVAVVTLRPSVPAELPRYAAAPGTATQAVRLSDGSQVTLRPGSTLIQTAADGDDVRYTLTGEALFDVKHNPGRRFEVVTPGGTVAVLGTRFLVTQTSDSTVVTLERGRVALTAATGARVELTPGEVATASPRGVTAPSPADTDAALDWLDGRLTFRRTAAAVVVAELERHYGIDVHLPEGVHAETVSGSLVLGTHVESLDALARVLGGRFETDAEGTHRFTR